MFAQMSAAIHSLQLLRCESWKIMHKIWKNNAFKSCQFIVQRIIVSPHSSAFISKIAKNKFEILAFHCWACRALVYCRIWDKHEICAHGHSKTAVTRKKWGHMTCTRVIKQRASPRSMRAGYFMHYLHTRHCLNTRQISHMPHRCESNMQTVA